jgi:hypothetical protein
MQTSKRLEGIGEYYFSQKLREIDEMNKNPKPRHHHVRLLCDTVDQPDHLRTENEIQQPNVHG